VDKKESRNKKKEKKEKIHNVEKKKKTKKRKTETEKRTQALLQIDLSLTPPSPPISLKRWSVGDENYHCHFVLPTDLITITNGL
jgi:hypothetical protein